MEANGPKVPSQGDIDRMTDSRITHDAELIRGGAETEDGILHPTAVQIEALRQKMPDTDGARERIKLLYDGQTAEDIKPLEVIQQEAERRAEFDAQIQEVLQQYQWLFDSKIPDASQNRRNWYGSRQIGDTRTVILHETERTKKNEKKYDYELSYTLGKAENTLKVAKVTISTQDGIGAVVSLGYDHGSISSITLAWSDRFAHYSSGLTEKVPGYSDSGLHSIDEDKSLANLYTLTKIVTGNGSRAKVRFNLQDQSLETYAVNVGYSGDKVKRRELDKQFDARYDPKEDAFDLVPYDDISHGTDFAKFSISRESYLEYLRTIVGLIPTIEL